MARIPFGSFSALSILLSIAACSYSPEASRSAVNADGSTITRNQTLGRVSATPPDNRRRLTAYVTGYSYWDNTPPGSAAIARPVVHRRAGGSGTYNDPITLAVGHKIQGGRQTLDFPAGTRFYIEKLKKYAIVEDVCGDGPKPQAGPCHTGYRGYPWIDIYVGGARHGRGHSNTCMRRLTGLQPVVVNPRRDREVVRGELTGSGCAVF